MTAGNPVRCSAPHAGGTGRGARGRAFDDDDRNGSPRPLGRRRRRLTDDVDRPEKRQTSEALDFPSVARTSAQPGMRRAGPKRRSSPIQAECLAQSIETLHQPNNLNAGPLKTRTRPMLSGPLDSQASRLRRKLNRSPEAACVLNVRGVGYRLVSRASIYQ